VEIACRFDFEVGAIEVRTEPNLASQPGARISARWRNGAGRGIPPFRDAAVVAEPLRKLGEIVAWKPDNGSNQANAVGRLGISAEKVVLGQCAHHAIAPEDQGKRFDDGGLSTVVRTDQHAMLLEADVTEPDSAEVLDS